MTAPSPGEPLRLSAVLCRSASLHGREWQEALPSSTLVDTYTLPCRVIPDWKGWGRHQPACPHPCRASGQGLPKTVQEDCVSPFGQGIRTRTPEDSTRRLRVPIRAGHLLIGKVGGTAPTCLSRPIQGILSIPPVMLCPGLDPTGSIREETHIPEITAVLPALLSSHTGATEPGCQG